MHPNTMGLMHDFRDRYVRKLEGLRLLDVGSLNVNGTYRPLFEKVETYIGLDVIPRPGVDIVTLEPFQYPFPDDCFDLIISGQAHEHSPHPWVMVQEMARLLKPSGLICLIAPWHWEIHRYPVDCFRILPDGMRAMMVDAKLEVIDCGVSEDDCRGIGRKYNWSKP